MKGRKPYPHSVMSANNDKERLTKDELELRENGEPKIESNSLECPEHLSDEAKEVWERIATLYKEIEQEVINDLDCNALEIYCNAVVLYRKAIKKVEETSGVYMRKGEKMPRKNPWLMIANQQSDIAKKYGELLLLNPVSRARMGVAAVKAQKGPIDPMEEFFMKVPPELRNW